MRIGVPASDNMFIILSSFDIDKALLFVGRISGPYCSNGLVLCVNVLMSVLEFFRCIDSLLSSYESRGRNIATRSCSGQKLFCFVYEVCWCVVSVCLVTPESHAVHWDR